MHLSDEARRLCAEQCAPHSSTHAGRQDRALCSVASPLHSMLVMSTLTVRTVCITVYAGSGVGSRLVGMPGYLGGICTGRSTRKEDTTLRIVSNTLHRRQDSTLRIVSPPPTEGKTALCASGHHRTKGGRHSAHRGNTATPTDGQHSAQRSNTATPTDGQHSAQSTHHRCTDGRTALCAEQCQHDGRTVLCAEQCRPVYTQGIPYCACRPVYTQGIPYCACRTAPLRRVVSSCA